eukprot:Opistho-1_new@78088
MSSAISTEFALILPPLQSSVITLFVLLTPTGAAADSDVRRIKSSQRWYSFYWNQHVYMPLLYTLLAIKTRLQDFSILYVLRRNGAIRVNDITTYHTAMIWLGKVRPIECFV